MIPDRKLIEGCIEGKRKAYALLYKRYSAGMLGVCLRYSRNLTEAEDVLQDGFIKVFGKISTFRHEGSFEGWIRRIMINTAVDFYHKQAKEGYHLNIDEVSDNIISEEPVHSQTDAMGDDISEEELMAIIQELPDGYRIVFNMYAIEGFSHQEIAETLQISVNTSKTQLFKARRQLRNLIAERVLHHINTR